jgi:quinol monooxygenase YgiN
MSDHISWHVELQVKPGQLDALRTLTSEMVESTKSEPGALVYERYLSDDRQTVHVFERYVDPNAAVAHLTAFGKLYGERFAKIVDRKRFTVFGTPTAELKEILDPLGAKYAAALAGFSRIQRPRPARQSDG